MGNLPTTVSVSRIGRWRWRVWATTIPAGGTRVDSWVCWGRGRAERKAAKVAASRNREARYAAEEYVITEGNPA